MSKKVLVIILTVIFVLTFSGCGNQQTAQTTTTQAVSSAAPEATATEAPKGPLKITVLTQENRDPNWPLSKSFPIIDELKKQANVEFEFQAIQDQQLKNTVQTRLAAGTDLPDLIYMLGFEPDELSTLSKQGLFTDLTDLMPKFAPNFMKLINDMPELKPTITADDGKMYWFNTYSLNETEQYTGLWLRRDFLNNVGITKLPDTTDEFYEAIKTMNAKDANQNGKNDEVYLPYQWWQFEWGIPTAFGVKNCDWNVDDNGKVYLGRLTPEYKDFLTFAHKLYAEKLTDPDIANMPWDKYAAKFAQNLVVGAVNCPRAIIGNKTFSNNGNSDPVFLPPIANKNGLRLAVKSNVGGFPWVITKDAKDVEGILKYLNYVYSPEGLTLANWGIEGVHYTTTADGKKLRTQQYMEGIAKDSTNYTQSQGFGFVSALPYANVLNTEDFITLNIDQFTSAKVNPDDLRSVMEMYKKASVPDFPSIKRNAKENAEREALGTDWGTYIDEMVQKFFMGVEPLDKFDDFVKKANELGAAKATEIQQRAYDRWKSVNK